MGEVWLADQVDGRVARQVALKLPLTTQRGDVWRQRFRRECDILARLIHPHIARLYDAGVSDADHQPYMAMEFVEGQSLIAYASNALLSIRERVVLFRQVLAAVSHAHRLLVVHRDLKPANILIDESGQAKLLDFGIAKLIEDDGENLPTADLTRLGGRLMTLRYAAPEQVTEGFIGTGADLYALGVILHELLTGQSPYPQVREGRLLTDSALVSNDAAKPSSLPLTDTDAFSRNATDAKHLAKQLAGDLDAIILKALRPQPQDRYGTAEQFDDDLARFLQNQPVSARDGNWRYLTNRFIKRNRLALAASAAVSLTIIAGVVLVEQQRRVAIAEKARAERHFASVRKLANTFMFDVHANLEDIPGSLKARQKLVATSLEYLDGLAVDAGNDAGLAVELATAYRKLAAIQGSNVHENIGEAQPAIRNLRKAASLLEPILATPRQPLNVIREMREVQRNFAALLREVGEKSSLAEMQRSVALANQAQAHPEATVNDKRLLAVAFLELAMVRAFVFGDYALAVEDNANGRKLLEVLVENSPDDELLKHNLASAYGREALHLAGHNPTTAQLNQALGLRKRSLAMGQEILSRSPNDALTIGNIGASYEGIADIEESLGQQDQAISTKHAALEWAKRFAELEPANAAAHQMMARVRAGIALLQAKTEKYEAALVSGRAALKAIATLPADAQATVNVRANAANAQLAIGLGACHGKASTDAQRREGRTMIEAGLSFGREAVEKGWDKENMLKEVADLEKRLAGCDAAIALRRGSKTN
jgi:serine/threonine protein kinase